jgi:hypothetical protein
VAQSKREEVPGGCCRIREAWKSQMNLVFVIQKVEHQDLQHKQRLPIYVHSQGNLHE